MKNLALITAVTAILGALALPACDSCPPPDTAGKKAPPPVTCGQGTVARGNTCVGTTQAR
jgi:hypothetical protein